MTPERSVALARWCVLAAALSVALGVAALGLPPHTPGGELAAFSTHRLNLELLGIIVLIWAAFSIPSVVATGELLRGVSPAFARAATLLSSGGMLLFGFAMFAHVGTVLALLIVPSSNPEFTKYIAEVWGTLWFFLTDPGLMTWGLGQCLFAWLARRSEDVPRWASRVGFVGGAAGLLTLAIYQSALFFFVQLAAFTVWTFAIGTRLK